VVYAAQKGARVKLPGLKAQRERRGLTQVQLAGLAGMNETSVVRAEHLGDVRPTNARKYAYALGCSIDDLVEEPALLKAV
jgi:DNA-binding XRE family transcriptional regulator